MIKDCIAGNHDLIEIHRTYTTYDEEQVVRWCRICGSVVVDIDVDGRTVVGGIMEMKAPESYKYKWVR